MLDGPDGGDRRKMLASNAVSAPATPLVLATFFAWPGDTSICRAHHFAAEPSLSRDRQSDGFRAAIGEQD